MSEEKQQELGLDEDKSVSNDQRQIVDLFVPMAQIEQADPFHLSQQAENTRMFRLTKEEKHVVMISMIFLLLNRKKSHNEESRECSKKEEKNSSLTHLVLLHKGEVALHEEQHIDSDGLI